MNIVKVCRFVFLTMSGVMSVAFANAGVSDGSSELNADENLTPSWERHTIDFESGLLWNVGTSTSISYRIVPSQMSWRSPAFYKKELTNASKWVIRNQASVLGEWVENGPESYYIGVSGAPSFEWWSPEDKWSVYFSIGGGVGVTDSQKGFDGLGQDFTLNWFTKSGLRYQIDQNFGVYGGAFFQHLSNGGQTDPNPGIDALGFTVGLSYSF